MKKIILIIILLALTVLNGNSQGWFTQNSGVGFNLNSVFFVDANTGYAVGDSGATIIKTTNGGSSWQRQINPRGNILFSVFFLNANTGYACGGNSPNGFVIKTINGGTNWTDITPSGSVFHRIHSIRFMNDLTGIAVGAAYSTASTIFRTTNGGVNWSTLLAQGQILYSAFFTNALTGFACGVPGTILKTTNAGIDWTEQISGTSAALKSIYFINSQTGWTSGSDSRVYKTINGGTNWALYYSPSLCGLSSVYFTNEQTGWACGCEGALNATSNNGSNWNQQSFAATTYLNSMSFISASTGWTVGNNGIILKTITGGTTVITPVSNEIPKQFSLAQNYPNPFNPSTVINFDVSKAGIVSIQLFDNLGREIQTLTNNFYETGSHQINFNAENLSAGIYYYKLAAEGFSQTRKMILVK